MVARATAASRHAYPVPLKTDAVECAETPSPLPSVEAKSPTRVPRSLNSCQSKSISISSINSSRSDLRNDLQKGSSHGGGGGHRDRSFVITDDGKLRVRAAPPESYHESSGGVSYNSAGTHHSSTAAGGGKHELNSASASVSSAVSATVRPKQAIKRVMAAATTSLSKASEELLNSQHDAPRSSSSRTLTRSMHGNGTRSNNNNQDDLAFQRNLSVRSRRSQKSATHLSPSRGSLRGGGGLGRQQPSYSSRGYSSHDDHYDDDDESGAEEDDENMSSSLCSDHVSLGDSDHDLSKKRDSKGDDGNVDSGTANEDDDDESVESLTTKTKKHAQNDEEIHPPMNYFQLFDKHVRQPIGSVLSSVNFQVFIVWLIVINSITMGIETFDFVALNPTLNYAFGLSDQIFLGIFTVELFFQFIFHGFHLFLDGWLLFDAGIVILSWSLQSMQVVRSFRIFRAFRLITRLKILKNLVSALFQVAPSMTAIVALLVLILYIFGVLCTSLFYDLYAQGHTDQDYFGTLDLSLFTLFDMMTLEWATVAREVMAVYPWASIIFSSFLVFTSFILYSLIIAVVCDAVKVTEEDSNEEEELAEKQESMIRLTDLQHRVDQLAVHQEDVLETMSLALQILQQQAVKGQQQARRRRSSRQGDPNGDGGSENSSSRGRGLPPQRSQRSTSSDQQKCPPPPLHKGVTPRSANTKRTHKSMPRYSETDESNNRVISVSDRQDASQRPTHQNKHSSAIERPNREPCSSSDRDATSSSSSDEEDSDDSFAADSSSGGGSFRSDRHRGATTQSSQQTSSSVAHPKSSEDDTDRSYDRSCPARQQGNKLVPEVERDATGFVVSDRSAPENEDAGLANAHRTKLAAQPSTQGNVDNKLQSQVDCNEKAPKVVQAGDAAVVDASGKQVRKEQKIQSAESVVTLPAVEKKAGRVDDMAAEDITQNSSAMSQTPTTQQRKSKTATGKVYKENPKAAALLNQLAAANKKTPQPQQLQKAAWHLEIPPKRKNSGKSSLLGIDEGESAPMFVDESEEFTPPALKRWASNEP